jgi:hypothetical protein
LPCWSWARGKGRDDAGGLKGLVQAKIGSSGTIAFLGGGYL